MAAQLNMAVVPAGTQKKSYRRRTYSKKPMVLKSTHDRLKNRVKKLRDMVIKEHGGKGTETNINAFGKDWSESGLTGHERQRAMRLGMMYGRGPGDYKGFLRGASRAVGAGVGGVLGFGSGGMGGVGAGMSQGYATGGNFSRLMGWGDYGPESGNQLVQGDGSQQQISVNRSNQSGDVFIEHTEFVQNVYASVASAPSNSVFQQVAFPINPGLAFAFPFLSQIAQNYVLYEPQGLVFQYKPTSGEYGNNSSNAIGKVIMATQYDPDAPAFINSIQMENYDYANATKPSCGAIHGVETARFSKFADMMYVRTGASTKDKVFTDLGTFYIATEGIPFGGSGSQTAIIGELWVTYRMRLSRANLYGALLGQSITQDAYKGTSSTIQLLSTVTAKSTNTIGTIINQVSSTAFQMLFPATIALGSYFISVQYYDVNGLATQVPISPSALVNAQIWVPMQSLPSSALNAISNPTSAAPTTQSVGQEVWLTVNAPGALQAQLQFNTNVHLAATSLVFIYVTQVNGPMSLALT